MDKETFLRAQYAEMIRSDEFVSIEWRESVDRFIADLWDRLPASRLNRYLAPRDPSLGYHRDNVEWHFYRPKRAFAKKSKTPKAPPPPRPPPKTQAERYAERRAAAERAKEERRAQLAAEFAAWEEKLKEVSR